MPGLDRKRHLRIDPQQHREVLHRTSPEVVVGSQWSSLVFVAGDRVLQVRHKNHMAGCRSVVAVVACPAMNCAGWWASSCFAKEARTRPHSYRAVSVRIHHHNRQSLDSGAVLVSGLDSLAAHGHLEVALFLHS